MIAKKKLRHVWPHIIGHWNKHGVKVYQRAVNSCPQQAHIVEVGAFVGKSTSSLIVEALNSGKDITIDVVDIWGEDPKTIEKYGSDLLLKFKKNLEKFSLLEYVNIIQSKSADASKRYENLSLDFVFIDAGHSYEQVREDIACWYPKVKCNGIIAGHDYYLKPRCEVAKAVREFFERDFSLYHNCWIHTKKNRLLGNAQK